MRHSCRRRRLPPPAAACRRLPALQTPRSRPSLARPSQPRPITPHQEYARALLVGARPGLAGEAEGAQVQSRQTAVQLAVFKAGLKLLRDGGGDAGAELRETEAALLVSALDAELAGMTGTANLTEVGADPGCFQACSVWPGAALHLCCTLVWCSGGGASEQWEASRVACCRHPCRAPCSFAATPLRPCPSCPAAP